MIDEEGARKTVSESGFPFQIRVEHLINEAGTEWSVEAREVPWEDSDLHVSGFVDMVASTPTGRLVIECKRRSEYPWVFIVPTESDLQVKFGRVFASWEKGEGRTVGPTWAWFKPESFEAEFCAVRGGDSRNKRTLEPEAWRLVVATEAIARELTRREKPRTKQPIAFLPVIVTNLPIFVCKVDRSQISEEDGNPLTSNVEEARWVRFAKTFASKTHGVPDPEEGLRSLRAERERVVLVVTARWLQDLLKALPHGRTHDGWNMRERRGDR